MWNGGRTFLSAARDADTRVGKPAVRFWGMWNGGRTFLSAARDADTRVGKPAVRFWGMWNGGRTFLSAANNVLRINNVNIIRENKPILIVNDSRMNYFNPFQQIGKTKHHLPHWYQENVWVFVTWRLLDSLPAALWKPFKEERDHWLQNHPLPWDREIEEIFHRRFSHRWHAWLDEGYGDCLLRDSRISQVVSDALHFGDPDRYMLGSYVIMPNHVHVLLGLKKVELNCILKSLKGYSAYRINQIRSQQGSLWQDDYWDRLIRSESHFKKVEEYIANNPRNAGLRMGDYVLWSCRG
jgi:putative transposase